MGSQDREDETLLEWKTGELDFCTYETDVPCARMTCGHYFSPEGMSMLYQHHLNMKSARITCPYLGCDIEFPYNDVRGVAKKWMSQKMIQEAETNLAINYMLEDKDIKQCPRCMTWCSRIHRDELNVTCIHCANSNNSFDGDFCWNCGKTWLAGRFEKSCGNHDCSGWGKRQAVLRTCKIIEIAGKQCPSIRACPKCTTLIEFGGLCRSMICLKCRCEFCFICLTFADKVTELRMATGDSSKEWTTGVPDMISLEDDIPCAKMPCGHYLGSESMAAHCKLLLSEKNYRITCPHPDCNQDWPYHEVRDVALLPQSERQEVEKNLAENFMSTGDDAKQCPRCNTWCKRIYPTRLNVNCLYCAKKNQSGRFDFCWTCERPWLSDNFKSCGNRDCSSGGTDSRDMVLQTCCKKTIGGLMCPSIRACPKCGVLIQHKDGCKSMICSRCRCEFCFVCLSYNGTASLFNSTFTFHQCQVAPIQSDSGKQSWCLIM